MTAQEMVSWTEQNSFGWMEGAVGGWPTYYPHELEALATVALDVVRPGGLLVEVGSYSGCSSSVLFQVARERKARVILIDPFCWTPEYAITSMRKMLAQFADVDWWLYPTTDALAHNVIITTPRPTLNGEVDFLHIDGDHTMEGVKLDCDLWLPHLRSGGAAAFHDYKPWDENAAGIVQNVDTLTGTWKVLAHVGKYGDTKPSHGCIIKQKP